MKKLLFTLTVCIAITGTTMANAEDVAALVSPTADVITSVQSANSVPNLEGTLQTADASTKMRQQPSKTPPGQRRNQQAAPAKNSNTDSSTEKRA